MKIFSKGVEVAPTPSYLYKQIYTFRWLNVNDCLICFGDSGISNLSHGNQGNFNVKEMQVCSFQWEQSTRYAQNSFNKDDLLPWVGFRLIAGSAEPRPAWAVKIRVGSRAGQQAADMCVPLPEVQQGQSRLPPLQFLLWCPNLSTFSFSSSGWDIAYGRPCST